MSITSKRTSKTSVSNATNNTAQDPKQLMKWSQDIQVTVAVDDIAWKLYETFPEDYKHKDLLTNAIIGTSLHNGTISYIYNALNGYSPDIDFEVGEVVICNVQEKRVNSFVVTGPGETPTYQDYNTEQIGQCLIIGIDYFSSRKLLVQYNQHKYRSQETETVETWVEHTSCSKFGNKLEAVEA